MRPQNSKPFTPLEKRHVDAVKLLPYSVCSRPEPSDTHHFNQGQHFTTVALCTMRERGSSPAHCQCRPDRQRSCDTDGVLPVFRFDENVLKGMRDGD